MSSWPKSLDAEVDSAELAALRKDKARLDWLASRSYAQDDNTVFLLNLYSTEDEDSPPLREAIDAAMEAGDE